MAVKTFASAINYGSLSVDTEQKFSAIYVGGAGNIVVSQNSGTSSVTFSGAVAGSIIPVKGNYIVSTGTTATNLVWLDW